MDDDLPPGLAAPSTAFVEERGLWFEEFKVATTYRHRPGRTITEADNILFSNITGNAQALHLDAHFAAEQPFGKPLVNSMMTLSIMVGASVSQLTQGTLVANLGFSEISFPAPLFPGDTLYCETTVGFKRLSESRPGQGIVGLVHHGRNQDGVIVGVAARTTLMWCEGARP
jgi:itaconyl-CoA hydratase